MHCVKLDQSSLHLTGAVYFHVVHSPLRNALGEDMTCQRMGGELGEYILEEDMSRSKGIQSALGRKGREQFPRAGCLEPQFVPRAGLDKIQQPGRNDLRY